MQKRKILGGLLQCARPVTWVELCGVAEISGGEQCDLALFDLETLVSDGIVCREDPGGGSPCLYSLSRPLTPADYPGQVT